MSMVGGGLGQSRIGVDGDRAIGFPRPAAGRRDLMRFALALLTTSPADLGVTLADLGRTTIDGKPYSGLRATGPDGFDCILLFDAQHRLVYSDFKRVDGIELRYTIDEDVAGSRTQIWHVSKVELNPKGLDKAFK